MDSDEAKFIDNLVSRALIVKDKLQLPQVTKKCLTFLTKVEIPSEWEEKSYKLDQSLPTYKYRLGILKKFIDKKKAEGSSCDGYTVLDELKQFLAESGSLIDDSFSESAQDQRQEAELDLFEQNIKLQGVVVRKSEKQLKVSVLVKSEDYSKRQSEHGSGKFSEFVVALQREDNADEEFHLKVAVGDIVEVTKCRRKQGMAWELEVIQCLNLSEPEIEIFLKLLSSRLESDGSTAAVIEITRCRAAWNYILEDTKKKDGTERTCQILKIVDKICSSVPMSDTVSEIVRSFHHTVFFKVVLPDFIGDLTDEKSFISMVQKILEHVITVSPASGLQVLPMATALAHKLVKTSSDLQAALDNGQSAVNFLAKLLRITASNAPGACKDIKDLPWKELPLIPMAEEIKKPRFYKTDDLPAIKKEGKYKSEEEYLNTHYRLLREECFYKLRKGIFDFVESGQKSDSTDMMMYRVWLRGAFLRHENSPTVMAISLEYEAPQTQASSEVENTGRLLFGSLLCISLDGSFQEPIWAIVDKHIHEQRIITITLCDKANKITEPQFICKMQEITNKSEKAFMAESQTFYVSYAPAMEVLQQREHVPFKECLVYPNPKQGYSNLEPAEYIDKITTPPDWGIIFEKDSLFERSDSGESSAEYSLLNDFAAVRLGCKSILDETQLKAVELALKHKLALIQGPPGTGKSFVAVALVRLLLSMNVPQDHGPILVVTYKNHALDNFLRELRGKVSPHAAKIVRVGRLADEEDKVLKKCLLRQVGGSWPEKLFEQKRKVMRQIWALQSEVREAFDKLRSSSIFNADMFIQEASKDQLKDLLFEHKKRKVTKADVDAFVDELPSTKAQLKVRELVENALKDWLPPQNIFDCFESKRKSPSQEKRESAQKKDDDDLSENPNDFKDPALEQRERLLVIDEEVADEEDEDIAKTEPSELECSSLPPYLRHLVCKDESEVEHYMDVLDTSRVWNLSDDKRAQLVYVFQSKFFSKASSAFQEVNKRYSELHHQLQELKNQCDIEVMRSCDVIGMTVTGATMRANLLADIKPSVVVVEEAAEILEGQLVAVITPSVQHLILIGDHKQLKPVVHFNQLKKKNLDLSMFERLVNCKLPFIQLRYQCRMRQEFVDLLHKLNIYDELLMTNKELVRKNDIPSGVSSCMYFWTHTDPETEHASHSKRNIKEADEITKVAKTFLRNGNVDPNQITVLCSYRGQVLEVKKRFYSATDVEALRDVTVTTIDAFQGQENDIILISLVRSNQFGKIGYLSSKNRLCVAISRARCGLYLFGNHTHFAKASRKGWKIVSDSMRKDKCLGNRFPFGSTEDSQPPSQTDSRTDGSSPSKETQCVRGSSITIHASGQLNVMIGEHNTMHITTSQGTVPLPDATRSPQSRKQPVQDPTSPPPGYRPPTVGGSPTQEAGSPTEEAGSPTKEAREPIQEFGKPPKEVGSPTLDPTPIQEIGKPKQEVRSPRVEAGSPTEGASLPTKAASEPIQEVGKPNTEVESPTLGMESLCSSEEGNLKDRPVQESASQGKSGDSVKADNQPLQQYGDEDVSMAEAEDVSGSRSRQGIGGSEVSSESSKEENLSTQETLAAGKGPFEETGDDVSKAVHEVNTPSETRQGGVDDATEVMKDEEALRQEVSGGRPKQETGSLNVETESSKEETLPSQETMAAGKGPFEETGDDVGKAVLETHTPGKTQSPGDTIEVMQAKDVPQEDVSGAEQKQENESLEVGTESSKGEGLPTQETTAAGKGPFEETGLEVGVKGHPTDE